MVKSISIIVLFLLVTTVFSQVFYPPVESTKSYIFSNLDKDFYLNYQFILNEDFNKVEGSNWDIGLKLKFVDNFKSKMYVEFVYEGMKELYTNWILKSGSVFLGTKTTGFFKEFLEYTVGVDIDSEFSAVRLALAYFPNENDKYYKILTSLKLGNLRVFASRKFENTKFEDIFKNQGILDLALTMNFGGVELAGSTRYNFDENNIKDTTFGIGLVSYIDDYYRFYKERIERMEMKRLEAINKVLMALSIILATILIFVILYK